MAKFSFGLNVNETAQENGYDQYQTTLKESLGAVAADNWELNPAMATFKNWQIYKAKSISEEGERSPRNQPILRVNRDKLNKQYSSLGLYFEQDEYQSVVDIMVDNKIEENERQSIMSRGPQGSFNPLSGGFYVGAAKLAVGIGVSFLDPINIGASFIPVVGPARFAQIVARTGLKTARAVRGAVEGAVGATILEPLIYSTAQKIQADYDLVDSFMNIGFGTIIGTGLHVGAGALKDIGTAQKFEAQIIKNRENLNLQNEIVKDTLDVPTKINIGESFNIFDANGNIVNAKITSISSSGNSVKVKLPNGSEQIINLNASSVAFQNIKSSNYTIRSAGLSENIQGEFISELNQKEIKTLKKELLERKNELEKNNNTNQAIYNDTIRDLNALDFHIKKTTSKSVDQEKQILKNIDDFVIDSELNLYNQYYPVNGEFMMKLEKTDPRTRELLLAKAIGDLSLENPVNVGSILDADATLREGTANPATGEIKSTIKNTFNDADINPVNKNIDNLTSAENDIVINRESQDLLNLRNRQTEQGLILKTDFGNEGIPDVLTNTTEALDDFNANSKEVEETIKDFINCENGNT
jgi:hypothetical protein